MGENPAKNPVIQAVACVFLLLVMLFELCCAGRETILKMEPPQKENPGIELPADVRLSLKEETPLKGRKGKKQTVWRGKQMAGEISEWHDGSVSLDKKPLAAGSPYRWNFAVPVEKIERIEFLGPSAKPGGFWTGVALGVLTTVASFLLYGYMVARSTVSFH